MPRWPWKHAKISTLLSNVLETYSVQLVRVAGAVVTNILIARLLTPQDRGLYAVALAVATIGSQFGSMGINTANVYFAARDPRLRGRLLANSLLISGVFGPVFVLVVLGIRAAFPQAIQLNGASLLLALVYIPFGVAYLLLQGLLLGGNRIRQYNIIDLLNRFVPLVLLAALAFARYSSPAAAIATAVVAQILSCVAAWTELAGDTAAMHVSKEQLRTGFRYGIRTHLTTVLIYLVLRVDLLMVAHLRGAAEAGYYSLATSVAEYMAMPAGVVGTILLPRLSATQDVDEKFRMMLRWLAGIGLIMLPVTLIALLVARPGISLLFGRAYLPAYEAFIWLSPGVYFLGLHCIAVAFITSIGYRMSVPAIWAACAAFNVIGNLYAIPRNGMVGASIVSSICYAVAFAGVFAVALYNRHSPRREFGSDGGVATIVGYPAVEAPLFIEV